MLMVAAREGLRPLGLRQKGRSRTWFDDHGWWLILVEFQPSAWSKGSYLNIGFQHLWLRTDHFSFGRPERVRVEGEEFISFDEGNPESFQTGVTRLVEEARKAVELRRANHGEGAEAVQWIADSANESIYDIYDAGVALGLLGDRKGALERFGRVLSIEATYAWVANLQDKTRALADLLGDQDKFGAEVIRRVEGTRETLRLGAWDGQIL
jgi:hypothetical protein